MNKHDFPFGPKPFNGIIVLDVTCYPEFDNYAFPELMGKITDLVQKEFRDRYLILNSIRWEDPEEPITVVTNPRTPEVASRTDGEEDACLE